MTDTLQLVAVAATVAAVLFGFFKWFAGWADRRHEKHHERFGHHDQRLTKNESQIMEIRNELHRDFVRTGDMHKMRDEFREDFQKLFEKLGDVSKDMNRLIGKVSNRREET